MNEIIITFFLYLRQEKLYLIIKLLFITLLVITRVIEFIFLQL